MHINNFARISLNRPCSRENKLRLRCHVPFPHGYTLKMMCGFDAECVAIVINVRFFLIFATIVPHLR